MTWRRLFWPALLAVLMTVFVVACDSTSSEPENEMEPRVGRGATRSTTLLGEKTVAQINAEFATLGFPVTATYPVAVYKIVYETIDAQDQVTQASGALLAPVGASGARPMMSYQHGTLSAKDEAPSAGGAEQAVGLAFATAGYVAVLPDLLGLGDSPGLHPYVHARTSATAVVDMLRAAQDFAARNGPDLNGQVFMTGYSQGGYTAMAALREIDAAHQDEFQIAAAAPMAGPYDLSGVMAATFTAEEPHPSPYYLPYTLLAYNDIYGLFDTPSDFLAAPYDTQLPPLFNGTFRAGVINDAMPDIPVRILNPDFVAAFESDLNHPLRLRLQENDVYDWTPRVPMRLYHCGGDRHVPPENTEKAFLRFQARGATQVEFFDPAPQADHGGCVGPSLLLVKLWFDGLVR